MITSPGKLPKVPPGSTRFAVSKMPSSIVSTGRSPSRGTPLTPHAGEGDRRRLLKISFDSFARRCNLVPSPLERGEGQGEGRPLQLDHAHPPHRPLADIDIVFAHE